MDKNITLNIAGLHITLTCKNPRLFNLVCQRYRLFLMPGETQFQIDVAVENNNNPVEFSIPEISFQNNQVNLSSREFSGHFDILERHASLVIGVTTPVAAVDYFLRVVFALMVFQAEGMMVHGAGILHNQCGYLFFGRSGSGKTTVSRSSVNDEVLNDDLVVLMPQGNTWRMYSTPFWNPTQVEPKPLAAPLTAMYRLVQDNKVYLETFKTAQALAELMANIPIISSDPAQSGCLMERCITLLHQVPAYRLHFLPDDSFWQVIAS